MTKPYLIVGHDYTRLSAGVRALHTLCNDLNERGYEAYVDTKVTCEELVTPTAAQKTIQRIAKDGIVVYPEVDQGNQYQAKRVARLLLNAPGAIRGDSTFPDEEMLFCYCRLLSKFVPEGDERVLTVPVIDTDVFTEFQSYAKREGFVLWVGKGDLAKAPNVIAGWANQPKNMVSAVGHLPEITYDWPEKPEELAWLFRHSQGLYSCYPYTALITEARLCGCAVMILSDGEYTQEEIRRGIPGGGKSGLAIWEQGPFYELFTEFQKAIATVRGFRDDYAQEVARYSEQLDRFIDITQGRA